MYKEKLNKSYLWLYFLIFPFVAAIVSIKNFRQLKNPNILWAFVVFYGFTFAIGNESQTSDIVRYAAQLKNLYLKSFTLEEAVNYFLKSGELDVVRIFVALVLSRFTDATVALTTTYALIFGYFFSRNIFYLLNQLESKIKPWTWFLVLVFFLIVPYWNLGGFRFWTATHIFIFGLLPYLFEGRKKSLWFCFLPLLFHFSFITPLLILAVYRFVPKNINVLFYLFVLTSFVNELDVTFIKNTIASVAPTVYLERTDSYLVDESVENLRSGNSYSQKNWYAVWYIKALSISIFISFIFIYIRQKKTKLLNANLRMLFCFCLWFYSIANLLSSFPSGGRFIFVASLICYFFIILCYQNIFDAVLQKRLLLITAPFLLLFAIVAIRSGFYTNSWTTLFGNPIVACFISEHYSLNDIIK